MAGVDDMARAKKDQYKWELEVGQKLDPTQTAAKTYQTVLDTLRAESERLGQVCTSPGATDKECQQWANVTAALLWLESRQLELPF